MKISFIIPTYNAEKFISKTVLAIMRQMEGIPFEIIVVDDGSNDDIELLFKDLPPMIKFYKKPINQGKGWALKSGLKLVSPDSTLVSFIDADLQINPIDIHTFIRQLEFYGADATVGNKRHRYSNVHYPFIRTFLSRCYRYFIKILFNLSLEDTQCGFKLFKCETIKKMMEKILCKKFTFDLEILVALKENDFRVVDAPVYVAPSHSSHLTAKSIFWIFYETLAVKYRQMKGHYKIKEGK